MTKGIFVTGTDTGVGKTHVTVLLLTELRWRGVRAAAFKPISCGPGGRRDAEIYAELMNHEQPLNVLNPIYLRRPLAPSVAAKLERRRIDLKAIRHCYSLLTTHYSTRLRASERYQSGSTSGFSWGRKSDSTTSRSTRATANTTAITPSFSRGLCRTGSGFSTATAGLE